MNHNIDHLQSMVRTFLPDARIVSIDRLGQGHINDTFAVTLAECKDTSRIILQRINQRVFNDPDRLMANVEAVTRHLQRCLAGVPDGHRRALRVLLNRDGSAISQDGAGDAWRAFPMIEGCLALDKLESARQGFQVARAFGRFLRDLADFQPSRLAIVIPDFHNGLVRLHDFERARARDPHGRAAEMDAEISFLRRHACIFRTFAQLEHDLPIRVTHNDTKINNVLLDQQTGEGLCVIDLDTVMPGPAPFDFGDMIRSATNTVAEDCREPYRVGLDLDLFQSMLAGYRDGTADLLTEPERAQLVQAIKCLALMLGTRFLTDHLLGDAYFRVSRPGQNRDRCRVQFAFFREVLKHENVLKDMVVRAWKTGAT